MTIATSHLITSNRLRRFSSLLLYFAVLTLVMGLPLPRPHPSQAAAPQAANCQGGVGGRLFSNGGQLEVEMLAADAGFTIELHLISPGPERLIATNREPGRIVSVGTFSEGVELVFGAFVRETGQRFLTGPASNNPDGLPHAEISCFGDGRTNIGFEDQIGGGDRDYNDLLCAVRQVNNCSYSISPRSQSFGAQGGSGSVNVAPSSGCSWQAVSNVGWIVITSGDSGSASGTVNYSVADTGDAFPRSGSITIEDQTFTVDQDGNSDRPLITSSIRDRKKLYVYGLNFDRGSILFLNGEAQKTKYDSENPTTVVIGKRTGKRIKPGDILRVQRSTGALSDEYVYTP